MTYQTTTTTTMVSLFDTQLDHDIYTMLDSINQDYIIAQNIYPEVVMFNTQNKCIVIEFSNNMNSNDNMIKRYEVQRQLNIPVYYLIVDIKQQIETLTYKQLDPIATRIHTLYTYGFELETIQFEYLTI